VEFSLGHLRLGIVNIDVVNEVTFQTACESEALIFIRVFYKSKWFGFYEVQVEYESIENGKKNVRERRLMLH
jgi:hypothetical protein